MNILFNFIVLILIIAAIIVLRLKSISGKIKKAEEYFTNEDFQKASEIVKDVLSRKSDFIPAKYLKARLLVIQNQYLLAISEFNNILLNREFKKYVHETIIRQMLAKLYNETKQSEKEINEYKILITFDPRNVIVNHKLGHVLFARGDYMEANQYLLKAIELDPSLIDCLLLLGITNYELSDYQLAENFLKRALDSGEKSSEIYFYLGNIYKMSKNVEAAIEMFEKSKENDKFYIESAYKLGEIYINDNRYNIALKTLEEGLNKLKGDKDKILAYRYLLAECYERENRLQDALNQLTKIVKSDKNYHSANSKIQRLNEILNNENISALFSVDIEKLQTMIIEIISLLYYNIISKQQISNNILMFKTFSIKRTNDPPVLILFNRTTAEVSDADIIKFYRLINENDCKRGIYISTFYFTEKAISAASTRMIELLDYSFLDKTVWSMREKTS